MAEISVLSRLVNGFQRSIDLSSNTLVLGSVKIGGASGTLLEKTALDSLISNSHTHANASDLANVSGTNTGDQTATTLPFTPSTLTDWSGDADPGNTDDALDQLASRVKTAEGDISTIEGDLADYIPLTQKGAASGVATLDVAGKVPVSQLPNSVMEFKGAWDASTNTPAIGDDAVAGEYASHVQEDITWTAQTIGSAGNDIDIIYAPYVGGGSNYVTVSGTEITLHIKLDNRLASTLISMVSDYPAAAALVAGTLTGTDQDQNYDASFSLAGGVDAILAANAGDVYRVSVEGTQDLGSGNITFYVGDFAIYSGTVWQRSPMASGVISVNTQTGAVVLDADDIDDTSTTNKFATATELSKLAGIEEGATADQDASEVPFTPTTATDWTGDADPGNVDDALDQLASRVNTAEGDISTLEGASHSHSNISALDDVSGVNTGDQTAATVTYSPDDQNNWQSPPTYVDGGLDELAARVVATEDIITAGTVDVKKVFICGETFAGNTSFLVRLALTGETAGRVFKATNAAAPTDGKFWAVGIGGFGGAARDAGGNIPVTLLGTHTLGSSDTAFDAADIGKPVWLTTAGGFSVTAPSASDTACLKIGIVATTTSILVGNVQLTGIN